MPESLRLDRYILVIEDSHVVRSMLSHIIQDEGYQVESCTNAVEAFDFLHSHPVPRLILVDMMLPYMNAEEFIHTKQQDPHLAPIPVAIITGYYHHNPDGIKHIVGYLEKPIELASLMALVSQYCD